MKTCLVVESKATSRSARVLARRRSIDRVVVATLDDQPIDDPTLDRVVAIPAHGVRESVLPPSLASIIDDEGPDVIFGPHTPDGRVILSAAAMALDAPFVPGITDCSFDDESVTAVRPFGPDVSTVSGPLPFVASVRRQPNAPASSTESTARSINELPDPSRAEVVVGVGRGGVAAMDAIVTLADHLDAGIVGTKPVVDAGILPADALVGTSGRAIAPAVYVAIGISGSFHHVSAIQDANLVIAITDDPRAPIVEVSNVTVIDDATTVLPHVNARLAA